MAWLAQSVEHQTFKADSISESSEGQGFESLIGRLFFFLFTTYGNTFILSHCFFLQCQHSNFVFTFLKLFFINNYLPFSSSLHVVCACVSGLCSMCTCLHNLETKSFN